jgi:catechol 2,3-dioxygenase-like lactoylglutathione lyase family enzyme
MSTEFKFSPHVAIQVRDRHRAVAFYREILGFELLEDGATESMMRKGPITFFMEGIDGPPPGENAGTSSTAGTTFWEFEVVDFAAAHRRLLDAGCRETKRYAPTSVMVADPYGLRFHLFQTGTKLPGCQ